MICFLKLKHQVTLSRRKNYENNHQPSKFLNFGWQLTIELSTITNRVYAIHISHFGRLAQFFCMHFRTSTSRLLYGVGVNSTKSIKKPSEVFLSFMQYLKNKWWIKELGTLCGKTLVSPYRCSSCRLPICICNSGSRMSAV